MPTCPNCGEIVMNGDPYCSNCGTTFDWYDEDEDEDEDEDVPSLSYKFRKDIEGLKVMANSELFLQTHINTISGYYNRLTDYDKDELWDFMNSDDVVEALCNAFNNSDSTVILDIIDDFDLFVKVCSNCNAIFSEYANYCNFCGKQLEWC